MTLLPHHQEMLSESAISESIINERGYESLTTKAALERQGYPASQQLVPTLFIPIWSVFDRESPSLSHHQPDHPRLNKEGKVTKYEFPAGATMVVDVHPRIREKVRDPGIPLIITEGIKKADSAISHGLCCIGLAGVWNFRGKNECGGLTNLPDWDEIAFKGIDRHGNKFGRQVYICFDSDVMLKIGVYRALVRLASMLEKRGAQI